MQLPIIEPAPIVAQYAPEFEHVFENKCQIRHFQNYLTGLIVLENKTMANITRCVLESADKTNLSRFFSQENWDPEDLNRRRVAFLLEKTKRQRRGRRKSVISLDDTLLEHVGSLFDYIDKHYNHGNGNYPLAHNLVTSHYVSGAVRFPVGLRLYRRYEEATKWERFVSKHFPDRTIPKKKKERNVFKKEIEATLLADPDFLALHEGFCTKISLASQLLREADALDIPFEIVLFDSWYLSPDFIQVLFEAKKNWISLLKKNRNLQTGSLRIKDADGKRLQFETDKVKVEDLIPLIPASAFKPVTINEQTYYCFAFNAHLPSLGKVRLVISYSNAQLEGTYAVLVTNQLSWNAQKILETYLLRWPIETFYRDAKQLLGLGDYRMRQSNAFQKHWTLVFVAYSFLHLDCLSLSSSKKASSPNQTIGEIVRQQTQILIEKLLVHAHQLLSQGLDVTALCTQLFAKQAYTLGG